MSARGWTWLLLAGVIVAACAERGRETDTIDVGVRPFLTNAPLYIAADEGFFEEEGLRVRFHVLNALVPAFLPSVERGDLDVIGAAPSAGLFNLIGRGSRLRLVADKGHLAPDACSPIAIIARRNAFEAPELGTAAAMAGRRIDIEASIAEGYYVETLLRRAGLTLADLELRPIPSGARLEAMRTGAVDLGGAAEPWVTHLLDAGHELFAPVNQIVPDFQWGFLVFGPSMLEDPEASGRFMRAYLRGVHRYRQGRTHRNIEILARRTGLEPALIERVCWASVRTDGALDTASLRQFQEWAVEKGMLDRVLSPEEYYDPMPVRRALGETGSEAR